MRRPLLRRASAAMLAVWLSATVAEQAVVHPCPLHDLVGAVAPESAHQGAAHHDAHHTGGHRPDPAHQCHCLERCAAAAVLALPGGVSYTAGVAPERAPRIVVARTAVAPARVDRRLPFANGPPTPHALVA